MELMTAKKYNKKYGVVDLDALEAAARAKAAARAEKRAAAAARARREVRQHPCGALACAERCSLLSSRAQGETRAAAREVLSRYVQGWRARRHYRQVRGRRRRGAIPALSRVGADAHEPCCVYVAGGGRVAAARPAERPRVRHQVREDCCVGHRRGAVRRKHRGGALARGGQPFAAVGVGARRAGAARGKGWAGWAAWEGAEAALSVGRCGFVVLWVVCVPKCQRPARPAREFNVCCSLLTASS